MKELSLNEFEEFCRNNPHALAVNVQPEEKFRMGHIPDSVNVPLASADFIHKISSLAPKKDQPLVIYSETAESGESMNAAKQLIKAGYNNVMNFSGGLNEWINAGRNLDKQ